VSTRFFQKTASFWQRSKPSLGVHLFRPNKTPENRALAVRHPREDSTKDTLKKDAQGSKWCRSRVHLKGFEVGSTRFKLFQLIDE
jgi:hypothetical protein